MKSNITKLVLAGLVLISVSCSKNEDIPVKELTGQQELKAELDEIILETIRQTDQPFDWNETDNHFLIQALGFSDNILVVGYHSSEGAYERLLKGIYESEGIAASDIGTSDDILLYRNDLLRFFYVRVKSEETLDMLRQSADLDYLECAGYPILVEELTAEIKGYRHGINEQTTAAMVLDPLVENPSYWNQVRNYSGGAATTMRRHNVDDVYSTYHIFGENTGVAVLDNGVPVDYQSFLQENGYGNRVMTGYYNPLWFLPFTEPDGSVPQPLDIFGLSQLIEGQWLHGWSQNQQVIMFAPNATQYNVRTSPLVLLLVPSQILGVINGLIAMADDPAIKVASMSMGTIFRIRQMENAIDYFNSKDKIFVCAAGTTYLYIRDLIGVIFPADRPTTVAVTGIENRENTGGEFVLGETSHGGPEIDFCTENQTASSEATSRMAGMIALVWSANPDLNRSQVLDVLKRSSWFYQQNGVKDNTFGWGTPDILQAVEFALAE